jgi:predicted PurR-regulated permease PerM
LDLSIIPKLAGIMIPLAGIAFPLVVIFLVLHFRERQREKLYETVKHFADRGMPVPRELLEPPQAQRQPGVTLRYIAITLIGVGVGMMLMFWSFELPAQMGIGGLVVCIGVAQWIALTLDAREARRPAPPSEPNA